MPSDIYAFLSKRIREERHRLKWTMEQLAASADISPGFLAYIEQNKKKPSLATIQRLAEALNISLAQLFKDAPVKRKSDYGLIHQLESVLRDAPSRKRSVMLQVLKTLSKSGARGS